MHLKQQGGCFGEAKFKQVLNLAKTGRSFCMQLTYQKWPSPLSKSQSKYTHTESNRRAHPPPPPPIREEIKKIVCRNRDRRARQTVLGILGLWPSITVPSTVHCYLQVLDSTILCIVLHRLTKKAASSAAFGFVISRLYVHTT